MNNTMTRAIVFGGFVRVACVNSTQLVQEAKNIHNLSQTATASLGRALTAGIMLSSELKGENEKLSITINGGGPLGKITVAGMYGGHMRGTVDNKHIELPIREDGKLNVGKAVGRDGYITVIKDLGLKEPYIGKCELVSGEIAEDITMYLLRSEQRPSSVALGVLVKGDTVLSAGGIICEILPNCPDEIITVVEDIVTNFTNISQLLAEKSPREIIDYYFGHFEIEYFDDLYPTYKCNCSRERSDKILISVGKKDLMEIVNEDGKITLECEFCDKKYNYSKEDVELLFN